MHLQADRLIASRCLSSSAPASHAICSFAQISSKYAHVYVQETATAAFYSHVDVRDTSSRQADFVKQLLPKDQTRTFAVIRGRVPTTKQSLATTLVGDWSTNTRVPSRLIARLHHWLLHTMSIYLSSWLALLLLARWRTIAWRSSPCDMLLIRW